MNLIHHNKRRDSQANGHKKIDLLRFNPRFGRLNSRATTINDIQRSASINVTNIRQLSGKSAQIFGSPILCFHFYIYINFSHHLIAINVLTIY